MAAARLLFRVQANVRKRILRAFVARGHLEAHDAKDMAGFAQGGGFSVDAGVCIEAADRAGPERLLLLRPPTFNRAASQTQTTVTIALSLGGTDRPYLRGVPADLPEVRGPPLWDECGSQESQEQGEGVEALPDWDLANPSPPNYSDDQRTTW